MRPVIAALLVLLAVGCTGGDEEGIAAGDCLAGGTLAEATEADCDTAHDFEVVGAPTLAADGDAPYPDADALAGDALTACAAAFAEHTGTPYEQADFDVSYVAPTAEGWADGDREVLCAATSLDGTPLRAPLPRS